MYRTSGDALDLRDSHLCDGVEFLWLLGDISPRLVLACGSRHWSDEALVEGVLGQLPKDAAVMHGGARGADAIADRVARRLGLKVNVFPAEWKRYGRAAGPIRNSAMVAQKPDLVIAFHDNLAESHGTRDTVAKAFGAGIPVVVVSRHGVRFMAKESSD